MSLGLGRAGHICDRQSPPANQRGANSLKQTRAWQSEGGCWEVTNKRRLGTREGKWDGP